MSTVSNSGDYVKKNHINQLFDDMKYQLLESHPEDPFDFLIKFLRAKRKLKAENDPNMKNGSLPNRHYDKPWLSGTNGGASSSVNNGTSSAKASKQRRASSALDSRAKSDNSHVEIHENILNSDNAIDNKDSRVNANRAGNMDFNILKLDEDELLAKEKLRSYKQDVKEETTDSNIEMLKTSGSDYKKSMKLKDRSKLRKEKLLEMLAGKDNEKCDEIRDSGFGSDEENIIGTRVSEFVTDIIMHKSEYNDDKSEISLKNSMEILCAMCKKEIKDEAQLSNAQIVAKSMGMSLMEKSYQNFFESDEEIESASQVSGPRMPVWKSNGKNDKNLDRGFKDPMLSARSNQSVESNKSLKNTKLSIKVLPKNEDRGGSKRSTIDSEDKKIRNDDMPSARSTRSDRSVGSNFSARSLPRKKENVEQIKSKKDDIDSLIGKGAKGWNIGDNSDSDTLIKEQIGPSDAKSISKAT